MRKPSDTVDRRSGDSPFTVAPPIAEVEVDLLVRPADVVKGLVLLVALIFSFTLSRTKHRHTAAVPL